MVLYKQEFTAAGGGGGGGDNEQRFGKQPPPVYPFNRWLTGTRAGQDVLERSLAPARTRIPDLSARMLLPTNWSGLG